jgi:hypothetical protein
MRIKGLTLAEAGEGQGARDLWGRVLESAEELGGAGSCVSSPRDGRRRSGGQADVEATAETGHLGPGATQSFRRLRTRCAASRSDVDPVIGGQPQVRHQWVDTTVTYSAWPLGSMPTRPTPGPVASSLRHTRHISGCRRGCKVTVSPGAGRLPGPPDNLSFVRSCRWHPRWFTFGDRHPPAGPATGQSARGWWAYSSRPAGRKGSQCASTSLGTRRQRCCP